MSMSLSLTPGSSAVTVSAVSSSAKSTRGASVPPMLRPNQSSNRESICVLKPRNCSGPPPRSRQVGSQLLGQDLLAMSHPMSAPEGRVRRLPLSRTRGGLRSSRARRGEELTEDQRVGLNEIRSGTHDSAKQQLRVRQWGAD